jgi:hypothetical protein
MPEVIVDLQWIVSLYQALVKARRTITTVEIGTYDLAKSDSLLFSARQIDVVIQSLAKIVYSPENYMYVK